MLESGCRGANEGERASKRPAAALAAFFARCEIARVLRGMSRACVFLRVYSSFPSILLIFLPRVSAGVRVWVAGRARTCNIADSQRAHGH